jgi:hypothetical protein
MYYASTVHILLKFLFQQVPKARQNYRTLRSLALLAGESNGQQLVYVVFSKFIHGKHLGGALCIADHPDLYKLYMSEVQYMRRKEKKVGRPGSSYNPRFQWSANPLFWPGFPESGRPLLETAYDVMDKVYRELEDEGKDTEGIKWLGTIPHFGGTKAMQTLQFMARLGLVHVGYCESSAVDPKAPNSGPVLVLRETCTCQVGGRGNECSCDLGERFDGIVANVRGFHMGKRVTRNNMENCLCIKWRTREGEDRRRYDLYFFDVGDDIDSFQNIIYYCRREKKDDCAIMFLFEGNLVRLDTFYRYDRASKSIEFNHKNKYEGFPQKLFP